MVTLSDLSDDAEFDDLLLDVTDEAAKFGTVVSVVIPRPHIPTSAGSGAPTSLNIAASTDSGPRVHDNAGIGRIFIRYSEVAGAVEAKAKLHGRAFNAKSVIASFYDEAKFERREYA
jgi:splicing factor U2AF subunit